MTTKHTTTVKLSDVASRADWHVEFLAGHKAAQFLQKHPKGFALDPKHSTVRVAVPVAELSPATVVGLGAAARAIATAAEFQMQGCMSDDRLG